MEAPRGLSRRTRPCRRELSADGHLEVARIAGTIGSVQSVLTRSDASLGDGPPGILRPLRPSPTVLTMLDDGLHGTVRYLTHVLRSGAYSEAAPPTHPRRPPNERTGTHADRAIRSLQHAHAEGSFQQAHMEAAADPGPEPETPRTVTGEIPPRTTRTVQAPLTTRQPPQQE